MDQICLNVSDGSLWRDDAASVSDTERRSEGLTVKLELKWLRVEVEVIDSLEDQVEW